MFNFLDNFLLTPSFRMLGRELGLKVEVFEGRLVIIAPMWRKALSTESLFCKAVVSAGYLTEEQMLRAARRYRLGCTCQGGVIFWQIGTDGNIFDGKVMYYREDCHRDKQRHPTWISTLLSHRHRWADAERMTTRHCFFGLHLLSHTECMVFEGHTESTDPTDSCGSADGLEIETKIRNKNFIDNFQNNFSQILSEATDADDRVSPDHADKNFCDFRVTNNSICVVESEKSAVILSEHFPQHIWLATGGLGNVQTDKFRPLRGRKVILFPDTDPDGKTFKAWYAAAQLVMQQPFWVDSQPITISPLLELNATAEQKRRKIDLVDFLFEGHPENTDSTEIIPDA